MLVVVRRIAPIIRDKGDLATGNAPQIFGIWVPVKFPGARDGHAPPVFVALFSEQSENAFTWVGRQKQTNRQTELQVSYLVTVTNPDEGNKIKKGEQVPNLVISLKGDRELLPRFRSFPGPT